ncbi:MAG: holo-ACP synthase [Candidatus Saganbacteria bacterium]|nr:holo-ACP synthase [Candidatus Saganbacteria bacterium]
MIKGVGIDIIEIDRIGDSVKKYGETFLVKVFTKNEINYCKGRNAYRIPELAVRFAAKEAYSKAIGTGISGFGRKNNGIKWTEIEVINNSHGKPMLKIKGKLDKKTHVSLSHSRDYAVASVYVEE